MRNASFDRDRSTSCRTNLLYCTRSTGLTRLKGHPFKEPKLRAQGAQWSGSFSLLNKVCDVVKTVCVLQKTTCRLYGESGEWEELDLSEAEKSNYKKKKRELKFLKLDVDYMEHLLKHAQLSEMIKKLEYTDDGPKLLAESGQNPLRGEMVSRIQEMLFSVGNLTVDNVSQGFRDLEVWHLATNELALNFLRSFRTDTEIADMLERSYIVLGQSAIIEKELIIVLSTIPRMTEVAMVSNTVILDNILNALPLSSESGLWAESSDPAEANITSADPSIKSQTVEFASDIPESKAEPVTVIDSTRYAAISGDADLGQFLSRPVIIDKRDLNVGTSLNDSINCWHLFLSSVSVARKIGNYRWIRGKLHLKFLINGGPAFYGKILVSYTPHAWIESHEQGTNAHALAQASQRVHAYIDPTESSGCEITCPFVYDRDYLGITAPDRIEVQNFGKLHYSSLFPLSNSQTTSARTINITCYAHMTDVELAGPTNTGVLPQSGLWAESSDEYGQGIVSKPASAVAKWAGKLKVLPQIAPYATATEMVAGGVGRLAHLFGYCRPVNVDPIRQYRPTYVGNLANTSIEEAVHKLTCDPKQGLTIDPRTVGIDIPGDELNVQQFTRRFSIVNAFNWGPAVANSSRLAIIQVNPALAYAANTGGAVGRQMTPLHMVQNVFSYWRGSLKFRFIVNASKFHRGRLAIVYKPDGNGPASMTDQISGEAFTRIIDISETRDFEIDIGWFQARQYLQTDRTITNATNFYYSPNNLTGTSGTVSAPSYDSSISNGTLNIYIVNELTNLNEGNASAGNINITWGVSACDDISFAQPNYQYVKEASLTPRATVNFLRAQSGVWAESAAVAPDKQTDQAAGCMPTVIAAIGPKVDTPAQNLINFGENFDSLRALFKRYVFYGHYMNPSPPTGGESHAFMWQLRNPNFPIPYGANNLWGLYQNRAVAGTPSSNLFTPFITPPFVMFANCFQARRGGLRHKYVLSDLATPNGGPTPQMLTTSRSVDEVSPAHQNFLVDMESSSEDTISRVQGFLRLTSLSQESFGGVAATHGSQNPTLEIEYPFYRDVRYDTWYRSKDRAYEDGHVVEAILPQQASLSGGEYLLSQFVATGEDYSLNWFVNCPILWQQTFPTFPS